MRKVKTGLLVSVVSSFYNEVEGVSAFVEDVVDEFCKLGLTNYELILVNDGCIDGTDHELDRLAAKYTGIIKVIHLSRNFGHSSAVCAGLSYAKGDAIILMDSDMQDDPCAFGEFLSKWKEGFDVVYAERSSRKENLLMRLAFWLFYRIITSMADIRIPADAGNYGLMDKRVVENLLELSEQNLYLPGLRAWVGFRQIGVQIPRRPRYDKVTRSGLIGKWRLAMNAVFSLSNVPLLIFRVLGLTALGVSLCLIAYALYHKYVTGLAIKSWTSEFIVTIFFGGINLFGIGIIGVYIWRIYMEVRGRPKYIIARVIQNSEDVENEKKADM